LAHEFAQFGDDGGGVAIGTHGESHVEAFDALVGECVGRDLRDADFYLRLGFLGDGDLALIVDRDLFAGQVQRKVPQESERGNEFGRGAVGWVRGLIGFLIFGVLLHLLFTSAGMVPTHTTVPVNVVPTFPTSDR